LRKIQIVYYSLQGHKIYCRFTVLIHFNGLLAVSCPAITDMAKQQVEHNTWS